jgi:RHS repeat-associated protein
MTVYEIGTLPLLGTTGTDSALGDVLAAPFHAHPFTEPVTGLDYVRARWFDPATGTFATPDHAGYRDSSNLYSFAAGDPINLRDPTGEDAYDDKYQQYIQWYGSQLDALSKTRRALAAQIRQQRRLTSDTGLLEAEDRIAATRMLIFGGNVEDAALFFDAARARGKTSVLSMTFEEIHARVAADQGVKTFASGIVTAFGPHAPQIRRGNHGRMLGRAKRILGDALDAYDNSWISSEVGAIGRRIRHRPRAASRHAKPIVLGETMDTRVEPVAASINAHTFQPRSKSVDPAVWKANQRRWIRSQISSGRRIFDLDIDPARPTRSEYYAIELEELSKVRHRIHVGQIDAEVKTTTGTVTRTFELYEWVP